MPSGLPFIQKGTPMIQVSKVGDLTFEVRFEEGGRRYLQDVSGWGTTEAALERILCNVIFGLDPCSKFFDDLSDDIPF
jgi:hypothetical protein